MLKDIVIIGSGNVGFHLAKAISSSGKYNLQVFNRSRRSLNRVARQLDISATSSLRNLKKDADLYILAIKDDAIGRFCDQLKQYISSDSVVSHTSGNVSISLIGKYFENCGSFYPLQSFKISRAIDYSDIPIFISSNKENVLDILTNLGSQISERVITINDEDRAKLHIPAVLVNNFTNYLLTRAAEYCTREGVEFTYLIPLLKETVQRVADGAAPEKMQTGPAYRNDLKTIETHVDKLRRYPATKKLYRFMTNQISDYFHENS